MDPTTPRWTNSIHLSGQHSPTGKAPFISWQLLLSKLQAQPCREQGRKHCHGAGAVPSLRWENDTPGHQICYQLEK